MHSFMQSALHSVSRYAALCNRFPTPFTRDVTRNGAFDVGHDVREQGTFSDARYSRVKSS